MAGIVAYPVVAPEIDDLLLGTEIKEEGSAHLTKNFTVGSIVNLVASTIPAGAVGPQGPQGIQGAQGSTGSQGIQGVQGNTGPQGVPGPVGPAGLEWKGSWVSGDYYIEDDAVGYDGASYFCILATSGVTAPDIDTTHWALLAAEGLQGPAGATGAIGATGPAGPQGIQGIQGVQGVAGPWGSITGDILSQIDLQNQFATYVPTARTITINGVTQDLSSNRTWTIPGGGSVNSVFGRTGNVIATFGDYTTSLVAEGANLYFTNNRARTAISLTTTGTSGEAAYNNLTGVLNIPNYAAGAITWLESNATDRTVWNNGKGDILTNTSFGDEALKNNFNATLNTAIGYRALLSKTTGSGNTAVGYLSMIFDTSGTANTALGTLSLRANTSGNGNCAVGQNSLSNSTSGNANVAVGTGSMFSLTLGSGNAAVGDGSGFYSGTTSSNNVYLGKGAGPAALTTENNKLYIANTAGVPLIGGDFANKTVTIDQVLVITPTPTTTITPVNGMIAVYGVGAAQHIYCYLNGAWKQLDN
jgi:hypothetical protein